MLVNKEFDEVFPRSDEYSPKKFYGKGRNKESQMSRVSFWLPIALQTQIGKLVEHKQIPLVTSSSEFYRDSMVHRLYQWGLMIENGELVKLVTAEMHAQETADIMAEMRKAVEMTTGVEEAVEEIVGQNGSGDARVGEHLLHHIEKLCKEYDEPHLGKLEKQRERLEKWLR